MDPWRLIERGYHPEHVAWSETVFALANGYLGMRGSLPTGWPQHEPATLINGFHETWPLQHPEEAYGLVSEGQAIVRLPDATGLGLSVDDEPVGPTSGRLLQHERCLDLQAGVLEQTTDWISSVGVRLHVREQRLVSLAHRHLAAFRLELEVLEGEGEVGISSSVALPLKSVTEQRLDPRRGATVPATLVPVEWDASGSRIVLGCGTRNSGMTVICAAAHVVDGSSGDIRSQAGPERVALDYSVEAKPGRTIRLDKLVSYDCAAGEMTEALREGCDHHLTEAMALGFDGLLAAQRERLDVFWEGADVRIRGDAAIQQAVRWNLFQLAQATLGLEGEGMPAKGLTGRGYDGHYFWDTEIYVVPFLVHTQPELARSLLHFRHGMLGDARENAARVGERGALFPWRTINGREASANYWTGTAQYHINADIAYALRRYVECTGDVAALREFGAELLVETARLWLSLGFHDAATGAFHIHGVTGPDEYTAVVDDNTYTNLMVREHLRYATTVVQQLAQDDPVWFGEFAGRLALQSDEVSTWHRAAEAMFVPYDEGRGIHPQDTHFLEKEVWDFAATPEDAYPLLLHHHPLVIYRFQVLKQADVVLAMMLLRELFSREQRQANFAYYEPITTGDSSLSHAVQSVMAMDAGEHELALAHFGHSLFMDFGNWAGNADDGVHIASAGGIWLALIHGFAGLSSDDGKPCFDPKLPEGWGELAFHLSVRGRRLAVRMTRDVIVFKVDGGRPLTVTVEAEEYDATPGHELVVPLGRG